MRRAEVLRVEGDPAASAVGSPSLSDHVTSICGGDGPAMARRLIAAEAARGARAVARFVFGDCAGCRRLIRDLSAGGTRVTWARGDTSRGRTVSSIQSFAVSGTRPEPVVHRGTALGFVYEDGHARYCRLGGVLPARPGAARDAQAREVFDTLAAALREAGFLFTDTVRTWFYLDRLLEWYAEFNAARTAFFEEHGVFDGIVPASTGIGAGNAAGAAVSADLLAVQPKGGAASVSAVPSPMQDSAMLYDSSFSRAVEIDWPDRRQLVVSGTAGIGRDGRTVRAGDPAGQIGVALDVVDALLRSRGMGWGDVTRGIAYFANLAHRPLFDACASERGAAGFPLAVAEAAICRPDLHFEIEVDAVRPVRRTRPGTRGPTPGTAPARGR